MFEAMFLVNCNLKIIFFFFLVKNASKDKGQMHAHTPTHTPSHLQTPPVLLCQRKHSSSPSLLTSPRRMQLGLKWNVKVALKRCLLYVNSTRHTYCSQHAGQNILSLLSTHTHTTANSKRWSRGVGGERSRDGKN